MTKDKQQCSKQQVAILSRPLLNKSVTDRQTDCYHCVSLFIQVTQKLGHMWEKHQAASWSHQCHRIKVIRLKVLSIGNCVPKAVSNVKGKKILLAR